MRGICTRAIGESLGGGVGEGDGDGVGDGVGEGEGVGEGVGDGVGDGVGVAVSVSVAIVVACAAEGITVSSRFGFDDPQAASIEIARMVTTMPPRELSRPISAFPEDTRLACTRPGCCS